MSVKYLAASLAHVRLLAGVHARVHGQSGTLDELLAAAGMIADVRANSAVDALW